VDRFVAGPLRPIRITQSQIPKKNGLELPYSLIFYAGRAVTYIGTSDRSQAAKFISEGRPLPFPLGSPKVSGPFRVKNALTGQFDG
jgi:hypothetical protein